MSAYDPQHPDSLGYSVGPYITPHPPTHHLASRTRGEREWLAMAEFCLTQAAEAAISYCDLGIYDPRGDHPTYPHAITYDGSGATINPTHIAEGQIYTLPYATTPEPPDR